VSVFVREYVGAFVCTNNNVHPQAEEKECDCMYTYVCARVQAAEKKEQELLRLCSEREEEAMERDADEKMRSFFQIDQVCGCVYTCDDEESLSFTLRAYSVLIAINILMCADGGISRHRGART